MYDNNEQNSTMLLTESISHCNYLKTKYNFNFTKVNTYFSII